MHLSWCPRLDPDPVHPSTQLIQPGNCPEGIYISALDDLDKWHGVIFVRRGYYQGCILGFSITFTADYPHRAPQIHFDKGSIVHLLVDVSERNE